MHQLRWRRTWNRHTLRTVFLSTTVFALLAPTHAAETSEPVAEAAAFSPDSIPVAFVQDDSPVLVPRPASEVLTRGDQSRPGKAGRYEAIIRTILDGPNDEERALGMSSSVPSGTRLARLDVPSDDTVEIYLDFPPDFVGTPNFTPRTAEHLGDQVLQSLIPEGVRQFVFKVKDPDTGEYRGILEFFQEPPMTGPEPDNALFDGTPPAPPDPPASAQEPKGSPPVNPSPGTAGALSGKAVVLNPGHGWFDDHNLSPSRWRVQRSKMHENLEDYGNAETIMHYLVPMLLNTGARVQSVREIDAQTNMVIVDNGDGSPRYVESGSWLASTANGFAQKTGASWNGRVNPFGNASATRYASVTNGSPTATATYTPNIPAAGYYNVYISYSSGSNRTTQAHWQVHHSGGVTDFRINQRRDGATWVLLGNFYFEAGTAGKVVVLNDAPDGSVVTCDAVRFGGGMGDVARRTNGVSGKARWQEEACNYLQYTGMMASTLMSGDNFSGLDDEQLGWGNRPQYAQWEQARDSEGNNVVYVGWHTNASASSVCLNGADNNGTGRGISSYRDVNADATAGTVDLTAKCHAAVVDNIKKFVSASFNDRGIVASNNYGECSQGNLGSVSGFFFEGLFHDNTADMALYKDPKFRHAVARGIVQGIISHYGGSVFPPEPPTHLSVRNLGNGQVRIEWQRGPERTATLPYGSPATGFRVYRSRNGYGFDNGTDVGNVTNHTITAAPGELIFIRVAALNSAGVSLPTETLAVRVSGSGGSPILIVNGSDRYDRFIPRLVPAVNGCQDNLVRLMDPRTFQSFNYSIQHGKAIAAAGFAFDSCADECIEQGLISLNSYQAVDWIGAQEAEADTGDAVDDTALKPAERTALRNFLNAGGRLFMSNSELAWDFDRSSGPTTDERDFLHNYMKAAYSADDANTYQARGSGGIFEGIGNFSFDNGTGPTYEVRFPDVLVPSGGAVACMSYVGGTGGTAAVQYAGPFDSSGVEGRVVYMGFGFETILSESIRNEVMARVLNFLEVTPPELGEDFSSSEGHGWTPFYPDNPGVIEQSHDGTNGALIAGVTKAAPGTVRVAGWRATEPSASLAYSEVGSDRYVRARFWVYSGGQEGSSRHEVPNMRLRVASRFAATSMLEVFHHSSTDPEGDSLATDFRPTTSPTAPSLYRVDLDPIDIPFLQANQDEGFQRGFEAFATEPQENGYLALTESTIGTYEALPDDTTPDVLIKVYDPASDDFADVYPILQRYQWNGAVATPEEGMLPTATFGPGSGITLDTTAIEPDRLAVAVAELLNGAAEDADPAKRARIEEGKLYKVRFHATSTVNSSEQAHIRFRVRTVKFQWNQKLEVGGAWAIGSSVATSRNAAIAQESLPGIGCLNPDKRTPGEPGGWYTVLMHSPLSPDIRADFPSDTPLAVSMPNLSSQDGPGVATPTGRSRRDIHVAVDLIDTFSPGPNAGLERGQVTVDRIEIRQYDLVD